MPKYHVKPTFDSVVIDKNDIVAIEISQATGDNKPTQFSIYEILEDGKDKWVADFSEETIADSVAEFLNSKS